MEDTDPPEAESELPVHPRWYEILERLVNLHGVTWKDAGYKSPMPHTRMFGTGKRYVTLGAANAYARALRDRGEPMPPPILQVIDQEDYEWITLGRAMRENNPNEYEMMCAVLRQYGKASEEALALKAKFVDLVSALTERK